MSSGHLVHGVMTGSSCDGGVCDSWQIVSEDATSGQSSVYNTTAYGQTLDWTFGGVLEVYNVSNCDHFTTSPNVTFDQISALSTVGSPVSPRFSSNSWTAPASSCGNQAFVVDSTSVEVGFSETAADAGVTSPFDGGISFSDGGVSPSDGGVFLSAVTFEAQNATTFWGQNVYVVGDVPELGAWNPAAAISLQDTSYPNWSGAITVKQGEAIQFKFIKVDGAGNVVWENGGNRQLIVPTTSVGSYKEPGRNSSRGLASNCDGSCARLLEIRRPRPVTTFLAFVVACFTPRLTFLNAALALTLARFNFRFDLRLLFPTTVSTTSCAIPFTFSKIPFMGVSPVREKVGTPFTKTRPRKP